MIVVSRYAVLLVARIQPDLNVPGPDRYVLIKLPLFWGLKLYGLYHYPNLLDLSPLPVAYAGEKAVLVFMMVANVQYSDLSVSVTAGIREDWSWRLCIRNWSALRCGLPGGMPGPSDLDMKT